MIDLKDDKMFMKLWKKKIPYSLVWLTNPQDNPELFVDVTEFTDFCKYIIDRAIDNTLYDDIPPSTIIGDTTEMKCMFSCCMGELVDDITTRRIHNALDNTKYKYASLLRDEYGFYSILFMCTGQAFIGATCKENTSMNIAYEVKKVMRKYFNTMPAERKCLMKLSGIDCVKEVFDL